MMKILTKDDIKKANDRKILPVQCPDWGGQVFVRNLTAAERDFLETEYPKMASNKRNDKRARLVVMVTCDEAGESIFNEADIEWLKEKSGAVLDRLIITASMASGWTPEDLETLGVK